MSKQINEPIKHHYIPKFILRNFLNNNYDLYDYYDVKRSKTLRNTVENLFVYKHLYRDEINIPTDPVKLEKDFSKYEGEISLLMNNKLLSGDNIELTIDENNSLLLFLALMPLRSKNSLRYFGDKASDDNKKFYSQYQGDGDILTLWRRNLEYLVNCRSLQEVLDCPNVDNVFKLIIAKDTFGIFGAYFVFVERRGNEDFILGDAYPLYVEAVADNGLKVPAMAIFPISPKRAVIVAYNGVQYAYPEIRRFGQSFFAKPFPTSDNKLLFRVRKAYEKDIMKINEEILDASNEGVIYTRTKLFHS